MTCSINKTSAAQNSSIAFKSKNTTSTNNSSSSNEGMEKSTKIMIGATALTSVVLGGLLLAKKCKLPNFSKLKSAEGTVEQSVSKATSKVQQTIDKTPLNMSETELSEWGEKNIDKLRKMFGKKRNMKKWKNGEFGHIVRKDSEAFYGGKKHKVKTEIISSGDRAVMKDYDNKGNLLRVYYRNEATGLQYEASHYLTDSIQYSVDNAFFDVAKPQRVYGEITGLGKDSKRIDYAIKQMELTRSDLAGNRKVIGIPHSVSGHVNI